MRMEQIRSGEYDGTRSLIPTILFYYPVLTSASFTSCSQNDPVAMKWIGSRRLGKYKVERPSRRAVTKMTIQADFNAGYPRTSTENISWSN